MNEWRRQLRSIREIVTIQLCSLELRRVSRGRLQSGSVNVGDILRR